MKSSLDNPNKIRSAVNHVVLVSLMLCFTTLLSSCAILYPTQNPETKREYYIPNPVPPPATVREAFKLDSFYQQWIDVEGLPVIASAKVNPYAVKEAAWLIRQILQHRKDILQALAQSGVRFVVIAHNEKTTQIPDYKHLRPNFYWDLRTRGLGARPPVLAASCGEENLLSYQGDPYRSNSILIHELSHAIHLIALKSVDPSFDMRLRQAFNSARKNGLWKNLYAISNEEEYWAEGAQFWFNTGIRNHIKTREQLKRYDPPLAALLAEVFADTDWRYTPVTTRTRSGHLQGYNPRKSPQFEAKSFSPKFAELNRQLLNPYSNGGGKWVDLMAQKPHMRQNIKSPTNRIITDIIFVNRTISDIAYYWIDYQGNERYYGRIAPNYHISQTTYLGHYWVVKNLKGQDLAVFRADMTTGRAFVSIQVQNK